MKRTTIIVITIILALMVLIIVLDKINEERCYNLPLNEFYNDNSCLKYRERLKNYE